jgi:hypothetical protein
MLPTWPAAMFQYTLMIAQDLIPGDATGPHMAMAISALVTGELDVELLDAAYDDLVASNEVPRSDLVRDGDGWVQRVHPHRRAHLDVRSGDAALTTELAAVWAGTPVPVDEPPLIRGQVVRLDDGTHLVNLIVHHVHTDPTSLGLAMAELGRHYTARLSGVDGPPPPVRFGEYVAGRIEAVRGRLDADREYWRDHLAGARPIPLAPGLTRDWSTPPRTRAMRLPLLDAPGAAALERWALRHRTTMFATLFTGFCLAMADRGLTRDILAVTAFEQRDRPEVREMIGQFIHPALLRVVVPPDADWASLVLTVRDVVRQAYDRAHFPAIDVLSLHQDVLAAVATEPAGICMFQYLAADPAGTEIAFGPARARVLSSTEVGPTGDVGLMFRLHRRPGGDLEAMVTFDQRDLREDLVRELYDGFADRVAQVATAAVG